MTLQAYGTGSRRWVLRGSPTFGQKPCRPGFDQPSSPPQGMPRTWGDLESRGPCPSAGRPPFRTKGDRQQGATSTTAVQGTSSEGEGKLVRRVAAPGATSREMVAHSSPGSPRMSTGPRVSVTGRTSRAVARGPRGVPFRGRPLDPRGSMPEAITTHHRGGPLSGPYLR